MSSPAEIYDRYFVPALFRQWGEIMVEHAAVTPADRVLDVACGTGALTCALSERVGGGGRVVGLDPNTDMLAVARRKQVRVEWQCGRAEALPFPDASFDRVVSQFGMMFFEDRVAALREMRRVLRPNGRLTVAVCDALDHSPGYAVLAELLERLFGHDVANAFRAPFSLGSASELRELCATAQLSNSTVVRRDGMVRFDTIRSLVSAERACVWTLGGLLDDDQFERLQRAAEESLRPFTDPAGHVAFTMPALIVCADAM